jgi:hypothetical protein
MSKPFALGTFSQADHQPFPAVVIEPRVMHPTPEADAPGLTKQMLGVMARPI